MNREALAVFLSMTGMPMTLGHRMFTCKHCGSSQFAFPQAMDMDGTDVIYVARIGPHTKIQHDRTSTNYPDITSWNHCGGCEIDVRWPITDKWPGET